MGFPAKKTIRIYLPAQVKGFAINNNSVSLTLEASFGDYEVVSWSVAKLNGSLQATPGIKVIEIQALNNYVSINSS